jgi:predicted transcriptional regulator
MGFTPDQKAKILKEFGENLEREIRRKFKNKEEYLRKTGFYRKTLHDIITGAKDARVSTLYRIAEELGISPRDFFPKKSAKL